MAEESPEANAGLEGEGDGGVLGDGTSAGDAAPAGGETSAGDTTPAGGDTAPAGADTVPSGGDTAPAGGIKQPEGDGPVGGEGSGEVAVPVGAGGVSVEVGQGPGALSRVMRTVFRQTPSWLVSMVVHTVILLVLALLTLPPPGSDNMGQIVSVPDEDEQLEEIEDLDDSPLEDIDLEVSDMIFESTIEQEEIDVSVFDEMEVATLSVELSDTGLENAPKADLLTQLGSFSGNALVGRGAGKRQLVAAGGGNEASEQAVASALKWLAEHQLPDGSWSFNHSLSPGCRGQCRNPGELAEARNGATGMALLPFLGAGQTHKTGKYKAQVKAGLYFLVGRMKVNNQGGSLYEPGGSMYSHGIASIVLCEAYAMTHDKGLYAPAQQSLNFIAYAQDPVGGGWRYSPRQRGDTSAVGWQIMAIKSGHMAYLQISPVMVQKAIRYLDSVQANDGAHYGYTDPAANRDATTAIGLLCRMYLGWKKDNPALKRGVKWISDRGPSAANMYYNYYATQVMRHQEGELWDKWNVAMRDMLVKTQGTKGHERGSWHLGGKGGHTNDRGGRLYNTSMATMVLEVYYRHLPIYRKQSTEEDFPLD